MNLSKDQIERILSVSDGRFVPLDPKSPGLLFDEKSNLVFRFIPGGSFLQGMSEQEEQSARAIKQDPPITFESMRPVFNASVEDLLVAIKPVTCQEYFELHDSATAEQREYCESWDLMHTPSSLPIETSSAICENLGLRLPTESEWEYFVRGGTTSLFFFGDAVPEKDELEQYLNAEFVPSDGEVWGREKADFFGKTANPFGLYGLFNAEACSDGYSTSYDMPRAPNLHVVRGGGSVFWPWQADEWIWCMSSMRISSKMIFEDRCCAFRPVFDISRDK